MTEALIREVILHSRDQAEAVCLLQTPISAHDASQPAAAAALQKCRDDRDSQMGRTLSVDVAYDLRSYKYRNMSIV